MILYPIFFKQKVVRRLSEIYTPRTWTIENIELPKNSTTYLYNVDDISELVKKEGFLTSNKDVLVKTVEKYDGDIVGNFRYLPTEVRRFIQTSAKEEPKINFIKNNVMLLKSNTLLVKSFLGLPEFYKYHANPLSTYWKFSNVLNTLVSEINKELDRFIFLPIHIDVSLHYSKFIMYMDKKVTSGLLKQLPSNDILVMFELWKMFFKDKRETSIFYKIKPDKFKNIHLMFYVGNRTVIMNFAVMLNIVKTMEELTLESGMSIIIDKYNNGELEDLTLESGVDSGLNFIIDMFVEVVNGKEVIKHITDDILTTESAILPKLNKLPENTISKLLYVMLNKINNIYQLQLAEANKDVNSDGSLEINKAIEIIDSKPKVTTVTTKPLQNGKVETTTSTEDVEDTEVDIPAIEDDTDLDALLDEFGEEIPDDEEMPETEEDSLPSLNDAEDEIINNSDIKSTIDNSDNDIKEDLNTVPVIGNTLVAKINKLQSNKLITASKQAKFLEMMKESRNKSLTINGEKIKIKDILESSIDATITEEEVKIEPTIVVNDKEALKNVTMVAMKKFLANEHEKLIIKTLYSVENSNFIISNVDMTETSSILGTMLNFKIDMVSLDGTRNTLPVIIPKVALDGTYTLSKNNYVMRKQRNDLPIRKISHNEVSLNSDYGKLFITRGIGKSDDKGYNLRNQLLKMYSKDIITNYVTNLDVFEIPDVVLPTDYVTYSKYIKMFNFKEYSFLFTYESRSRVTEDLAKYETDGVVIGTKNGNVLIMRYDSLVYEYVNGKYVELGTMAEILELDMVKEPYECITIKLFKTHVPLIFLLGYYYGVEKVLDHYKIKYYYEKLNTRVDNTKYIVIKLSEDKLVIERSRIADIIFSGLLHLKNNSQYLRRLNTTNDFDVVFNLMGYSLLVRNEISNIDEMFIGPVTLEHLKQLKLPLTFRGLLFKAVDMLEDYNYKNPKAIEGEILKGYDRFSSMLYKEMTLSLRDQRNRSEFSKSTVNFNPYALIKKLNEDSTTLIVNDLNPIANLKQFEDVTYLGAGGRSKESLSKSTRGYDVDDIGILSEANKDSGDVGITSFLTATPNVKNILGMVENLDVDENTSWSNLLSISAMIAPFAINDDTKRLVFSGIQNEHIIPMINMDVPYVRVGPETLIANKLGGKYAIIATGEGIVKYVDSKKIVVDYNGTLETYKLYSWYSKIESNTTFKHTLIPNVKVNDKTSKDDVLAYIDTFFRPDPYDANRVIYLQQKIARLAFIEDLTTYEDSLAISDKLADKMYINNIKLSNMVINATDNIVNITKIGNKLKPDEAVLTVSDQAIDLSDLSEDEIELMNEANNSVLKAKYFSEVDSIEILYNCELEEMSDSLRELVITSDKKLKERYGYTGRVNSSYSIQGRPLQVGQVEVRIFLKASDSMGLADKAICGSQLKCTVGDIFKDVHSYVDKKPIDAVFSTTSFEKRITPSFIKIGILTTGMKIIEENAIAIYFK